MTTKYPEHAVMAIIIASPNMENRAIICSIIHASSQEWACI